MRCRKGKGAARFTPQKSLRLISSAPGSPGGPWSMLTKPGRERTSWPVYDPPDESKPPLHTLAHGLRLFLHLREVDSNRRSRRRTPFFGGRLGQTGPVARTGF